jgi:dTDP-4-dehydrorhamnose reductase
MMPNVLVTGATGFIGSYVCKEYASQPSIKLFAAVRDSKKWLTDTAENIVLDFSLDSFQQTILDIKPDVIVHTAALSQVDYCEQHRNEAWQINVEATRLIAEAAQKMGSRLIFLSSDFVFSGQNEFETENSPTNPVSFYGETKVAAEKYVRQICKNHLILRPVLVYGIPLLAGRQNMVTMVKRNLEDGKAITIVSDQYRTPVFVGDLTKLIVKTAMGIQTGTFHAGGPDYLSVYEFAVRIARTFNLDETLISPITSAELNQTGKRPPRTRFDNRKAIGLLGFTPMSVNDALKQLRS